ncbi:MAG: hypothetical protein JETCAE01_33290 [Anaerolineaceae bacterium]|nr:MAG: hypothetical protein JETCAE01_33290 [Anaerolineaceae bacterium]
MAKISAYTNGGTPANNDLFIVARSGSNVKLLYSAIVTALTAVFNGLYAAAANGVTNGDSHDHVGGDGAAIVEAAITLADNTTNNASATKHGFLKKLSNIATEFMNGQGNWAAVKDSDLSLSDITTNDASATKHGFLKKLSNIATEFMNGQGNWAAVKDSDLSLSDITTNDASTSAHGFVVKATAPAAGQINIVAIGNGETGYSNKALFDATTPQNVGTAATGTATTAARSDHVHGQASFINMGTGSTLTISGGKITVTESFHRIDTEGGAATDDLDTINGGSTGDFLILASVANARDPTLKDSAGNLRLNGDCTLTTFQDTITLVKVPSGEWYEISRSDNA